MTQRGESRNWPFKLTAVVGIGGAVIAFSGDCILAQKIKPDATLGAESSSVTHNILIKNLSSDRIEGGARRGGNLFHSFQEFNIDEGRGAYFTNPIGVDNILTRVTGKNRSDILGTLGVLGKANLFLINPNGILFGQDARLDVRGSFVSSTTNAIQFGEQGLFSASTPEAPSLLTVNPSAFLFNQIAAQPITNQSVGGLQVPESQSLLLLGGDVSLDGGVLVAPGGRVELGSIAGSGTVGLNVDANDLSLTFPDNAARSDISLSNGAGVDVLAGDSGSIDINARNLDISGGSVLAAGIGSGLGSVGSQAGDIKINATDTVFVKGTGSGFTLVANQVQENSVGNAGNIDITTGSLSVTNGVQLNSTTFGEGNAGSVIITASEKVLFDEETSTGAPTGAFSRVGSSGRGNGGGISITTGSLEVTNGAILSASTRGEGDAGTVMIQATESIVFDGEDSEGFGSGAFSQVGSSGRGNGGGISITTGSLEVTNGAELAASTLGRGNAGSVIITASEKVLFDGETSTGWNSGAFSLVDSRARGSGGGISITTGSLEVTNGAQLSTLTSGKGDAGTITIRATDSIVFDGRSFTRFPTGVFSVATPISSGDAGSLAINTSTLLIRDEAQVSVSSEGSGRAGELTVEAGSIHLDNQGTINATTNSGNGGDIKLQTQDLLLMRRNSNISTTAGTPETVGSGGSITIDTDNLVALENSDIDANAFGGRGGQVFISAQGIFGTAAREQQTPASDITASSDLGPQFSGNVQLNTPDIDPSQGLANLPIEPVNPVIAQECQAGSGPGTSRFISSGKGGIPTNPYEPLDSSDILAEVQLPTQWANAEDTGTSSRQQMPFHRVSASAQATLPNQIIEAQGWSVHDKGEVMLVAEVPPNTSQRGCRLD